MMSRDQELREKYSDRYCLSMQTSSSQSCDINCSFFALTDKIQAEFAMFGGSMADLKNWLHHVETIMPRSVEVL
jgi:hypothetical protein